MPIYDKPTKTLMREFAERKLAGGQVFAKSDAVRWFADHYPKIKPGTVQAHVEAMAVNSRSRKHYPNIGPGSGHDLFFKVGPGRYRLWDPESDPRPIYGGDIIAAEKGGDETVGDVEDEDEELEAGAAAREFAFERDLRNYLSKNLDSLEAGLRLYEDEGLTGVEFPVGGRYIDILAVDAQGEFVVIELKVSRGYDRAVGQLLRYMGWVEKNLARDNKVRGMIVANEITEDLKLAASRVAGVRLFEYGILFNLNPVE